MQILAKRWLQSKIFTSETPIKIGKPILNVASDLRFEVVLRPFWKNTCLGLKKSVESS